MEGPLAALATSYESYSYWRDRTGVDHGREGPRSQPTGESGTFKRRGLLVAAGTLLAGALAKASERVARATDGLAIIAGQANASTLETSSTAQETPAPSPST